MAFISTGNDRTSSSCKVRLNRSRCALSLGRRTRLCRWVTFARCENSRENSLPLSLWSTCISNGAICLNFLRNCSALLVFALSVAPAWATDKANTSRALQFLKKFKQIAPFEIQVLQSDNGSEFSRLFSQRAKVTHRHSRVRRPNDNAHLERFNRTLQDELVRSLPVDMKAIN